MGLQLIFVVESDNKSQSDFMYIKSAINYFYSIGQSNYKLSPVYMGGKGNYDSNSVKGRIEKCMRDYGATSLNNKSVVFYCLDCDNYNTNQVDHAFFDSVQQYCNSNDYKLIWFCKDIEHVFLGKQVDTNKKVSESIRFMKNGVINKVDSKLLYSTDYKDRHSNICLLLDAFLTKRKFE